MNINLIQKIKRVLLEKKNWIVFFAFLFLIHPTISSLFKYGYFPMHDDMQAMRVLQMDKCIKDGQIPCRWVPDMGYGYGYPQFNYYSPFPYYVMEIFHVLGLSILDSVKAGFVVSVLLSAFGMYLLGKSLWGKWGGFISSFYFVFAPYRALDMYVRGAVGEFWAMGFLPIIFWSAKETLGGSKTARIWLAISLAGLLTSHNITSLIFLPILILWISFNYFTKKPKNEKLIAVFGSICWGFAISAFFLLPALLEKSFVHIETLTQGYFNYLAHFVSIGQILFSSIWGYGSSELGPYDDLSFSVGILHWILPLMIIFLLTILKKKKELVLVIFFVSLGIGALFFTHQKSVFIWQSIPILSLIQFPWRFLTLATFCFSVSVGALALLIPQNFKFRNLFLLIFILLVISFNASFFRPREWLQINDQDKFSGELWEKQLTISIFDYLPIYAKYPPSKKAPGTPLAIRGEAELVYGEKGTNWQKWNINVSSNSAILEFPLYYFPGWKVWIDGNEAEIDYKNELGLITVSIAMGEHTVVARLTDTPVRSFANILTFAGLALIPIVIFQKSQK